MIILMNGSLCEESQALVSAYDHGFLYGMGLFETFRTYQGKAFLLDAHLERLSQGCKALAIELELKRDHWEHQIEQLLKVNQLEDGYFRLTVSAGADILGLPANSYSDPTIILYVKPLPVMDIMLYEQGKALQLLRLTRNSPEGDQRLKSFHYMNNIMAKRELAEYPWAAGAEGLFLNQAGYMAEGIVSNIFFVRQGGICTPEISTGILAGITRQWVLEHAGKDHQVEEGLFGWQALVEADEIFLTNSIQELVPVTVLFDVHGEKIKISNGSIGPVTHGLLQHYRIQTSGLR